MDSWPSARDWLFSAKTFAGAMLALYLAFWIGLDRPYWAMATAYIVAQPLAGSVRSKALYRLIGTLLGAAATLVLVPNLVNAPELLVAAFALWTAVCLYIALLDRTPRSYVFMLAGYTVALVGFPSVDTPGAIWDVVVARVEEIILGIVCATMSATLIFPAPLGTVLSARIIGWVSDASDWAQDALAGVASAWESRSAHVRRLAADAVELRLLTSQLGYDTSAAQDSVHWVREVQRRMALLLPLLSGIADRMAILREAGTVGPRLEQLLADLCGWVQVVIPPPPHTEADRLRAEIADLQRESADAATWNDLVRDSLLARLRELVDIRQDMRELRLVIEAGGGALPRPLAFPLPGGAPVHRDHGIALLSGLAAALAIIVFSAWWIASGWPDGAQAASLVAVSCCLFATLDDPTPAQKAFTLLALVSITFCGVGLFGILPQIHDFETLTYVLALFFIPAGLLIAHPRTQLLGGPLCFLTATLLTLQNRYSGDFAAFINSSLSALLGLGTATVITALVRSVGAEWSARRLLRAIWGDIAAIPEHHASGARVELSYLLVDRLGLLVPRLAAAGAGNDLAAADALADLRIGVNMIELLRDRGALPAALRAALSSAVSQIAGHYRVQMAARHVVGPPERLLHAIDTAFDAAQALPRDVRRSTILHLVGLRRGLFPAAAPYQPPVAVAAAETLEAAAE